MSVKNNQQPILTGGLFSFNEGFFCGWFLTLFFCGGINIETKHKQEMDFSMKKDVLGVWSNKVGDGRGFNNALIKQENIRRVKEYFDKNEGASIKSCCDTLDLAYPTVRRHLNTLMGG